MGKRAWVVFVLAWGAANLAWWASGFRWTPWAAGVVNGGTAAVLLVLWGSFLMGRLILGAAASATAHLGFDGLARPLHRAAGSLHPMETRLAFRLAEMELSVRREDFAGADALWDQLQPHLGRPEVSATRAVACRAASLLGRGRLAEALEAVERPEARDDAREVRDSVRFPGEEALRLGCKAAGLAGLGRVDEARACLDEARPKAAVSLPVLQGLRLARAELDLEGGLEGGAHRQAREAMAAAPTARPDAGWAVLLARCGAAEEAEELLRRPLDRERTVRTAYLREMAAGFVAAARDRRPEALARFDAGAALATPPGEEMLAAALRARDWGEAEAAARYAAALEARNPESVWAARAREAAGEALEAARAAQAADAVDTATVAPEPAKTKKGRKARRSSRTGKAEPAGEA